MNNKPTLETNPVVSEFDNQVLILAKAVSQNEKLVEYLIQRLEGFCRLVECNDECNPSGRSLFPPKIEAIVVIREKLERVNNVLQELHGRIEL